MIQLPGRWLPAVALTVAVLLEAMPLSAAEGGIRQPLVLPRAGTSDRVPPPAGTPGIASGSESRPADHAGRTETAISFKGTQYIVTEGRWYAKRGTVLKPVAPPEGVLVKELPDGYSMRWVGGVPYFSANGLYYVWRERKMRYEIVPAPPAM